MEAPYSWTQDEDKFYVFFTEFRVKYSIFLLDAREYFGLAPNHECVIYYLGFSRDLPTDLLSALYDPRVEQTIVAFLIDTLSKNLNCIVYTASPLDRREKVRLRLFERWHSRAAIHNITIEKISKSDTNGSETALLLNRDNPYKDEIMELFRNLP